jgi:hypothetical protein
MRICPTPLVSLTLAILIQPCSITAEPVAVKYTEGSVHGFLALRTQEGKILAAGDLIQTIHGERVVSRLVFHFKDGSIDDETTVFTQRGHFRLISDHHIQRGSMFPKPTDVLINAITGQVTVRYKDKGQEKVETDHLDLPPDLANGILLDVLKNLSPDIEETNLSYVVAAPKPRLIKLSIKPEDGDTFWIADAPHKSIRFVVKVELGGIVGMVAPLIGKQPANTDVWVSVGQVPAFVKLEGPFWRQTTLAKRSDHKSGGL